LGEGIVDFELAVATAGFFAADFFAGAFFAAVGGVAMGATRDGEEPTTS
jgi:hypothetical protein